MTVGDKLHQALAGLESAQATMTTFALDTQDAQAKKMYSDYASQLQNIVDGLKGRINYVEQQEPQFNVGQQIQQKAQQRQQK